MADIKSEPWPASNRNRWPASYRNAWPASSESADKALVAQILSSYLSNNTVAAADLSSVIDSVKRAFGGGSDSISPTPGVPAAKVFEPVVPVKKSVTPEVIICLCCGERFKSLKRHLQTAHELSPTEYKAAFDLKSDYPIVAPNYAAQRSALAKSLGLGRKPAVVEAPKKARAKSTTRKMPEAA